jgi:hypothetical protein
MSVAEVNHFRALEIENARLKNLLAECDLENGVTKEIATKK